MMEQVTLEERVSAVLAQEGDTGKFSIAPLAGGGNNRLYRLDTESRSYLVKQYFRNAGDLRDRQSAEKAFLKFAASAAPGFTPRLLAIDEVTGISLLEFIEGRRLIAEEIGSDEVAAALRFFDALNLPEHRKSARLENASEACFSIDAHLTLVGERVAKLCEHLNADGETQAISIGNRLLTVWQHCRATCIESASSHGISCSEIIGPDQRCISPSDFGFHNAIRLIDGSLRFIDFEYAGWDDPAKTVSDFFYQPQLPVPEEFIDCFAHSVADRFGIINTFPTRVAILRPLFGIKWCCIVLNIFIPMNLARRTFAINKLNIDAEKMTRLMLAEKLIQRLENRQRSSK